MDLINFFHQESEKVIVSLKEELKTLRTGRASPALIENLMVEAYGGQSQLKLKELATISVEDPTTLVVAPFDPSTISELEKAILKSPLHLSPQTQSNRIIIKLPPLTAEQRQRLTKILGQIVEEKKTNLRNLRDSIRKKIKTMFEEKQISEDEKFRQEKEIDNLTQKRTTEIQTIKQAKEQEITQL